MRILLVSLLFLSLSLGRPQNNAQDEEISEVESSTINLTEIEETTLSELSTKPFTEVNQDEEITTTDATQDSNVEVTTIDNETTTKSDVVEEEDSNETTTEMQDIVTMQDQKTETDDQIVTTENSLIQQSEVTTDTTDVTEGEDITSESTTDNEINTTEENEDRTEISMIESTSVKQSVVRTTKPPMTLHIQNQSQRKVIFKRGNVLGLQCEATSKVDIDIKYSWTKNGRFMDVSGPRIFLESAKRGNVVILKPSDKDVGMYQCVASNSEGVVFSRVVQVESKQSFNSIPTTPLRLGGGGRALNFNSEPFVVLPTINGRFSSDNIMIVESQPYIEDQDF